MKVTSQEEIGLRLMMALAEAALQDKGEVRISSLAKAEGIGSANTAKVLNLLNRSGLVRGLRGVKGGYVLARPPEEITLYEVLSALADPSENDSRVPIFEAGRLINCPRFPGCNLKVVWAALEDAMRGILERVTLKDIALGTVEELEEKLGIASSELGEGASILTTTVRQSKGREQR